MNFRQADHFPSAGFLFFTKKIEKNRDYWEQFPSQLV